MLLAIASLVSSTVTRVDATVYVDAPFAEKVFDSVAYFDFKDTRWPYIDGGDMLIGPTSVLTSASFDEFFIEYQTAQQHNDDNEILPDNSNTVNSEPSSPSPMAPVSNDFYSDFQVTTPPNFLIVEYGSSPYSSSLENIRHVAEWINADFVVLVVNRDASWKDKFMFWWSHKFPGIPDGVLEKESQIVNKNNSIQCAFLAIGARQGRGKLPQAPPPPSLISFATRKSPSPYLEIPSPTHSHDEYARDVRGMGSRVLKGILLWNR